MSETSTKPYLLRALYEWCNDNGYTPHIAVYVDQRTSVPQEFVSNDEIILNISNDASYQLKISNAWIKFEAHFSGRAHKVEVPVANVLAIYALENGQGMAFPVEKNSLANDEATTESDASAELPKPVSSKTKVQEEKDSAETNNKGRRGHLTVIK